MHDRGTANSSSRVCTGSNPSATTAVASTERPRLGVDVVPDERAAAEHDHDVGQHDEAEQPAEHEARRDSSSRRVRRRQRRASSFLQCARSGDRRGGRYPNPGGGASRTASPRHRAASAAAACAQPDRRGRRIPVSSLHAAHTGRRPTSGETSNDPHHRHPRTTTSTSGATGTAARAEGVSKLYGTGDATVAALDNVSVGLDRGRFTAIMGPSGSGKSTLLHMLAGLDRPTSGEVYLGDTEITSLNDKALTLLRRDRIGFIFQSFNLLPTMTAAENIVLPMRIAGRKPDAALGRLDRRDRRPHRPPRPPADAALRRPAAARRRGPCSGVAARDRLRGRADRCPGLAVRHRAAQVPPHRGGRARPDRRHGHPRRRPRPATPTGSSSSPTATSSTRCTTPTADDVLDYMKHLGA